MISHTFEGQLTLSGDTPCRMKLAIELSHNPATNPFAFDLIIANEHGEELTVWTMAVDLLFEGSTSHDRAVGHGDVKVKAFPGGTVGFCLTSPEGHAHIGVSSDDVQQFLLEVGHATPDPDCIDQMVDSALEEILRG